LCGVPINILQFTVSQLALNHQRLHELILSSLWEGIVTRINHFVKVILINTDFIGVISQKEAVRLAVTELLSSVMPYLSDINITNRIVPALITLSNDSNWFVINLIIIQEVNIYIYINCIYMISAI